MKKLVVTFAAVVIFTSAFSFPSVAHHGNGGQRQEQRAPQQTVPQCTIDTCIESGSHMHEGTTYNGHIAYCTINGCTVSGNQLADGSAYCRNHTTETSSNETSKRGHHGRNHY